MKVLTLYIDKWYIIGAICSDGRLSLIKPQNNEECFWLYFYEDIANDDVFYGKDNKQHFLNRDNHYYGDIFSLIVDPSKFFYQFGHKHEIKKIFSASGIIDELKGAFESNSGKIDTYISFAKDISYAARYIFLKEVLLQDGDNQIPGFNVVESSARIGHLALEHARKNTIFKEDGYYLILNACNENLLYSLYEYKEHLFLRKAEKALMGMGTDLRGRALVENVVKSINQRTHFLNSDKELEHEYSRLMQYVDNWIVRLENARPGLPVTIPNISLSGIDGNTYQATILKSNIDARTNSIVNDIIREISTFVRDNNVTNDMVKGILFLGNTFTNSQFLTAIKGQYLLPEKKYVNYQLKDLPGITAVYTVIPLDQFSTTAKEIERLGEAELESLELARQEERANQKAAEERRIAQEKEATAKSAEQKYQDAMNEVEKFEREHNYEQMADWAKLALSHRPNDEEANKKLDDAQRLLNEQKVKADNYKRLIRQAQGCLDNSEWQEALSHSLAASNIMPESAEAIRIKNEAETKIKNLKEIEKFINRADLFKAQKSYDEALNELKKVLTLDPKNQEASKKIKEIEDEKNEYDKRIKSLMDNYKSLKAELKFNDAITVCEQLADLDKMNPQKWLAEAERLKAEKKSREADLNRFEDLKAKAWQADFKDEWENVIHFAEEALLLISDEDLRNLLNRAKEKQKQKNKEDDYQKEINKINSLIADHAYDEAIRNLNELQIKFPDYLDQIKAKRISVQESIVQTKEKTYLDKINNVKSLIDDGQFDDAEVLLNSIQKDYPEHYNEIKSLRKDIVDKRGDFATSPTKKRPPIGFQNPTKNKGTGNKTKSGNEDDFFKNESTSVKKRNNSTKHKEKQQSKTTGDDFFDKDSKPDLIDSHKKNYSKDNNFFSN